jgi:bacteriophage HK97-gp10 putative tail-component
MEFGLDPNSKKDMAKLMANLRKIAPDVAKKTRARFKAAAEPTLAKIHERQPKRTGELRRKTKISIRRGVTAIVSSADHSRISEFGGRHPLWGDREHWVNQPAVPAIFSTVREDRAHFLKEADNAVYQACREAGFK